MTTLATLRGGPYKDVGQGHAKGTVRVVLNGVPDKTIRDPAGRTIWAGDVSVPIVDGLWELQVPPSDDPTLSVWNFSYLVVEQLDNVPAANRRVMIVEAPSGATVDMADVEGAIAPTPVLAQPVTGPEFLALGAKVTAAEAGADAALQLAADVEAEVKGRLSEAALTATIGEQVAPLVPRTSRGTIWAGGDSLTDPTTSGGGGWWWNELAAIQGVTVIGGGRYGQSSTEVAMRQGGIVPVVTIPSGSIPASGPVAVTVSYPEGAFKENQAGAMPNPAYVGTLAGVPGTLTANTQGAPRTWTFTRATTGDPVAVAGARYFVSTEGADRAALEQIWWTGRNFSGDLVLRDTAAMRKYVEQAVAHPRFSVLNILTSETERVGTADYDAMIRRNRALRREHGEHYVEVRRPLIDHALTDLGIAPTPGDLTDIAGDTVPRSLRSDTFHLNEAGSRYVGRLVARHRTRVGYDRTGAIIPAPAAKVVEVVPSVLLNKRYSAAAIPDSAVDTVVTALPGSMAAVEPPALLEVTAGTGATARKTAAGVKYLQFGTDDRMYLPSFTRAAPYTLMMLFRIRATGTDQTIAALNTGTPATPRLEWTASGGLQMLGLTLGAKQDTGWHVAYCSAAAGGTILGLDGASVTGAPTVADVTGLRLGQGPANFSSIDIAEVMLWSAALSPKEIDEAVSCLRDGYPSLLVP